MKAKDLTLTAILLALLIVLSQLSVPIGPIPITLQTLAVLFIGYFLSPRSTVIATFTYLVGGLVGLPIFSNFQGGLQSVLLPSFGFILSFIPAAFFQALYLRKKDSSKIKHLMMAGIINFATTYSIGLIYMAIILNVYLGSNLTLTGILMAGFLPFIPGDLLKLFISISLAKRLLPILEQKTAVI